MSYDILSDCPSAALWHTATKLMGYWREGSTSVAIPPTSACDVMDQHNKIGGISFGAPLVSIPSNLLPNGAFQPLEGKPYCTYCSRRIGKFLPQLYLI